MKKVKVLAINPGSTSTKIALFENEECLFSSNVPSLGEDLSDVSKIRNYIYDRCTQIKNEVEKQGYQMNEIDACSARGGEMGPCQSGIYAIDDVVLNANNIHIPVKHPATLSAHIANVFASEYSIDAYTLNPPTVDELMPRARLTGIKGVYRSSILHTLNQKEVANRIAEKRNKRYEDMNMVVAHLGGGISISAHKGGQVIDTSHAAFGDGPMAPTRVGSLDIYNTLDVLEQSDMSANELRRKVVRAGGLIDHLGTADAREIGLMIKQGDKRAKLIYDSMIYQISKYIGSMSVALEGNTEVIVLTGGLVHDDYLVAEIKKQVSWIADIELVPGEFEMEALANGVLRVLGNEVDLVPFTCNEPFDVNSCVTT